ncbi:ECF transporter S component [Knoellia sp. p5-6-4]|uniref:ECF transporter S component n=1 Tax=unclassified Knoellia TaxID=2618719 RepID=UPI0023D9C601|nr:ECF transporter S component [Knoellia sp. p5-6-4]MDF2145263.1 ECF transporter S component [Knoellia sp. p5-6-4]
MSTTKLHTAAARGASIRASRPLMGWRTVDLLSVAFLGAAFGVAYWGWGILYNGPLSALQFAFAPLGGLFAGTWFVAGVVGGLVVRRPGAALLCEVIAALVSMLPGTEWGATVLVSGIVQGLGAELVFALFGYRFFGLLAAVLAGAMAGPFAAAYESTTWIQDWSLSWKLAYAGVLAFSGAVVAGLGGWALTRALAGAGALNAFPPGQEAREHRAV